MPISNPVKRGYAENRVEFTYKGGNKLFHFSPRDNNLSNSMENNIILFADNKNQAKKILKDMCEFIIKTEKIALEKYSNSKWIHSKEFAQNANSTVSRFSLYLNNIDRIKIVEAPMNQIYVVGWADNDELH